MIILSLFVSMKFITLTLTPPLSPRKKTRLEAIKQYMFYTFNPSTQQRGCVTAYSKRRLATFAHLIHKDLFKDGVPSVKVTIYSLLDNTPYEAKVVKVDEVKDLIILETDHDVCEVPPIIASPEEGEEYFQLGLSALTQENSPFAVTRGAFISRQFSVGTKHRSTILDQLAQILGTAEEDVSRRHKTCCLESMSEQIIYQFILERT